LEESLAVRKKSCVGVAGVAVPFTSKRTREAKRRELAGRGEPA
jgi:hypothetical protein